jgi:hypothetical protein
MWFGGFPSYKIVFASSAVDSFHLGILAYLDTILELKKEN